MIQSRRLNHEDHEDHEDHGAKEVAVTERPQGGSPKRHAPNQPKKDIDPLPNSSNQPTKGATGDSPREQPGPGPRPIGESIVEAVLAAFAEGPGLLAARIEMAILDACPAMRGSWAPGYVARQVARGMLPPAEVAEALLEYSQVRRSAEVRRPAGLLAAILRRHLADYNLPWKNIG
jgi:hypothetical protein